MYELIFFSPYLLIHSFLNFLQNFYIFSQALQHYYINLARSSSIDTERIEEMSHQEIQVCANIFSLLV